jgi:ACS family tartrate transporter-like MFS transporter
MAFHPAQARILISVSPQVPEQERRIFAKIAWRLGPILTLSYFLNYLDRNNVGFAALTMNREIGLTATQFGTGAGIFFLGYCFFEIPSSIALYRVGARLWIARIMITWGVISVATIFAVGPRSWYFLRFLLGVAEAGFFPGVTFYLASWFPAEYRARMLAWFLVAIPATSLIGGPISGSLLGLNGAAGLTGWKWLFILEGVPTVLLGIAVLWILTDRPEDAAWLSAEERRLVRDRIEGEHRENEMKRLLPALKDPRVLILAGVQFGFTFGSYGAGIWLPQIIKESRLSNLQVGFVTSACYVLATVGMIVWAVYVDKSGKKIGNLTVACLISAIGLFLAILVGNFWISLAWVSVALLGITAARAIFWTIPTRFLTGIAAAGGLALINSIGTVGGFAAPPTIGWLKDRTGSFSPGLLSMAAALVLATGMAWSLKLFVKHE